MIKGMFADSSFAVKIIMTIVVVLVSFFIVFMLGILISLPFFDASPLDPKIYSDMENPVNISVLKFMQIIQSIGLFIVPPFILAYIFKNKNQSYLSLKHFPSAASLVLVPLAIILSIPVINFFAELNSWIVFPESLRDLEQTFKSSEESAQRITELFLSVDTVSGLLMNLFMMALIPAVGEELLFRGVFQKLFTDAFKSHHLGILISAILFSAIHMQFYGFFPRMFLGMLFGYLLVWSKSMWLPMLAHFVNNGFIVVLSYIAAINSSSEGIEDVGSTSETMIYALYSFVIISGVFYIIYRKEKGRL